MRILRWVIRSPILAGVNVVFGVVAGLVGATFHDELVDSVPLVWLIHGFDTELGGLNTTAIVFWGSLFLFAGIWALREYVAAADRRREVRRIELQVYSGPPPEFLNDYDRLYKQSVRMQALANKHPDKADEYLRWVLDAVIRLAALWDSETSGGSVLYRANVMVAGHRPMNDWDDAYVQYGHRCYGEDAWGAVQANAEGGLYVDSKLATSHEADGAPDEDVSPLLLIYSQQNNRDVNLIGAPEAFVRKTTQYVPDTADIYERFPKGLSETCQNMVRAYVSGDQKARSLLAIPIPGEYENKYQVTGILNVYRNSAGIMGSQARAINFSRLIAPFALILGRILPKVV